MSWSNFMADSVAQIIALATVLAAVGGIGVAIRGTWRWMRQMNQRLDDLMGEPARPGFEARPGVMERLKLIDETLAGFGARLGTVETDTAQLRRNGGHHLADAVHRMEAAIEALTSRTQPNPAVERPDAA